MGIISQRLTRENDPDMIICNNEVAHAIAIQSSENRT